ncbi:MAG: hypothetical protein IH968_01120 [Gemmatimonadetes bacterium]|nr:hypothetical protein [Gemmatimonadota bacterium]
MHHHDAQHTRPIFGRGFAPAMRVSAVCVLAMALVAFGGSPLTAQTGSGPRVDSLRAEVAALRAQLDSLFQLWRDRGPLPEQPQVDPLERLRAAARAAAGATATDSVSSPQEAQFVGRQRSLQLLNPEISLTGELLANLSNQGELTDNFIPREFELSMQSALDPYALAKIFIIFHQNGGDLEVFPVAGGEEKGDEEPFVEVEEGYIEWRHLPGGFSLKFGKFFQQFSKINRWHLHALPFQSRSLPQMAFIGGGTLGQTGASLHWLLPVQGFGTWEATFEVTRSSNEALFGESKRPSYLGHVNAFWQLSTATDFELGFSGVFGDRVENDVRYAQRLFGIETAFNWIPPGRSRYRGLTLRAGAMVLDPERRGDDLNPDAAKGAWAMGELKMSRQWLLGARLDWVEDPSDTSRSAWLFSPTLTFWESEFVRFRAEYDFLHNPEETRKQFTIRVTFAMGPHRHEAY